MNWMSKHKLIFFSHTHLPAHLFFYFSSLVKTALKVFCTAWGCGELNYSASEMLWDTEVEDVIVPQQKMFFLIIFYPSSPHFFTEFPPLCLVLHFTTFLKGKWAFYLTSLENRQYDLQKISTTDNFATYSQNKSPIWSWIL